MECYRRAQFCGHACSGVSECCVRGRRVPNKMRPGGAGSAREPQARFEPERATARASELAPKRNQCAMRYGSRQVGGRGEEREIEQ